MSQPDGADKEGRRIRASFPPRNDGQRRDVLRYARETPFAFGTWTHLKWLYKQAEGTAEAEILGALIGRLDAEGFRSVAARARPAVTGSLPFAGGTRVYPPVQVMAVHGSRIWISAGYGRGVRCVDVSNPQAPAQVALFNPAPAWLATFDAGRVYSLAGGRAWWRPDDRSVELQITEEQGGKIRSVGSLKLRDVGRANAFVVFDGWAYLTTSEQLDGSWSATLRVLDVRDPARAKHVAAIDLPSEAGAAQTLTAIAPFLYVPAHGHEQSLAVDVSDPAHPVVRGTVPVSFSGTVAVQGALAYQIRSHTAGGRLRVLDVSDPAHPAVIGSIGAGRAQDLAVDGSLVYLARTDGLRLVDVSNPRRPVYRGYVLRFPPAQPSGAGGQPGARQNAARLEGVAVRDGRAYVAVAEGLQIVDVSAEALAATRRGTPSKPTLGYMKRRARRLLRGLAQSDPDLYARVAYEALKQAGRGRQELSYRDQWVSLDVLLGRSPGMAQRRHGRGPYVRRGRAFSLRARHEWAPAAWDRSPDLARSLLADPDLPWEVHEAALKMLHAGGQALHGVRPELLSRFMRSPSLLLKRAAAAQVPDRIAAGYSFDPALVAEAFFLGSPAVQERLLALPLLGSGVFRWHQQFAQRLLELVAERNAASAAPAAAVSRRTLAAALAVVERFAEAVDPAQLTPAAEALLRSADPAALQAALELARNAPPEAAPPWLAAVERLPQHRRALVLDTLIARFRGQVFDEATARALVFAPTTPARETGWALLAAGVTVASVLRAVWEALAAAGPSSPALATALASAAAAALLARARPDAADLLGWLSGHPALLAGVSAAAFGALLAALPPEAAVQLVAGIPDDAWPALRETLAGGLRGAATGLPAFWRAVAAALGAAGEEHPLRRRLLDDPLVAETLLALDAGAGLALLEVAAPAMEDLLLRWTQAHAEVFASASPSLLALATHPSPRLREWGLQRAQVVGFDLPFALRLVEAGFPQSVQVGQAYFEAIPPGDEREVEAALALCDSPLRAAQVYGRQYVETRRDHLPMPEVLRRLAEHPDPGMLHWVAAEALRYPKVAADLAPFDRQVLRARDRGRKAKELVKQRLAAAPVADAAANVPALLELARSQTRRDAEWAYEQLARLARSGVEIEGFSLGPVAGV